MKAMQREFKYAIRRCKEKHLERRMATFESNSRPRQGRQVVSSRDRDWANSFSPDLTLSHITFLQKAISPRLPKECAHQLSARSTWASAWTRCQSFGRPLVRCQFQASFTLGYGIEIPLRRPLSSTLDPLQHCERLVSIFSMAFNAIRPSEMWGSSMSEVVACAVGNPPKHPHGRCAWPLFQLFLLRPCCLLIFPSLCLLHLLQSQRDC